MQTILEPPQILQDIRAVIADDLHALDQFIYKELFSDIPLIQDITRHIIKSGGKRLRPLLVLLSARACGYQGRQEHVELAVIIEFVHTATLLHDDVVDQSHLRRGQQTANALWGNQASVLVGDFLYSRAFQILSKRCHMQIMQVLANTTNAIAEGEVLQLMNQHQTKMTEDEYFSIIYRKTAKLFESASEIGAILGNANNNLQKDMANYGLQLGIAFQIIDDLLDYTANINELGKNLGDDLADGKLTLPLIYALQQSNPQQANIIHQAIKNGHTNCWSEIVVILEKTHAKKYTLKKAQACIDQANASLKSLPNSIYKNALEQLLKFAISRSY